MFQLGEQDRDAFFALMDEYFQSRPQYAPAAMNTSALPTSVPPSRAVGLGSVPAPVTAPSPSSAARMTPGIGSAASSKPPLPPPRRDAVKQDPATHLTSSISGGSAYSDGTPASALHREIRKPEGLQSGKSFGSIKTDSAGSAFGAVVAKTTSSAGTAFHNKWSKHNDTGTSEDTTVKTDYYNGGLPDSSGSTPSQMYPASSTQDTLSETSSPLPPPTRAARVAQTRPGDEAVALYTFAGTEPGDLPVKEGEHVYLLEAISDDWWRAQSLDGSQTGIVPSSYVQKL
ncbi:hypothetical protein MYAM1_002472 [Malassezia yamatoensis]|uniref:SH3 domain-containing protein n=1 Tax=Malassezia yamatoensis TaxID=253288 RepID=A0AAJ5YY17_9BASI|nr:hypothetical protein MYAM1_002472 [Malassezia yamatoensis]